MKWILSSSPLSRWWNEAQRGWWVIIPRCESGYSGSNHFTVLLICYSHAPRGSLTSFIGRILTLVNPQKKVWLRFPAMIGNILSWCVNLWSTTGSELQISVPWRSPTAKEWGLCPGSPRPPPDQLPTSWGQLNLNLGKPKESTQGLPPCWRGKWSKRKLSWPRISFCVREERPFYWKKECVHGSCGNTIMLPTNMAACKFCQGE